MKYFGHSHPLELSQVSDGKQVICSCCEESLAAGEASYLCTKPKCRFSLHKACSEFPKKIQHKYDVEHKLMLNPKLTDRMKKYIESTTCKACENKFNAFSYGCERCDLYFHPKCAFMQETVKRDDHEHPLKLYTSSPYGEDAYYNDFRCDVCETVVHRSSWVYYCSECDYGTHFGCVKAEPEESSEAEWMEEEEEEETVAAEHDKNKSVEDEDAASSQKKFIRVDGEEKPQQHFSHHHDLSRLILDQGQELRCKGCHARNDDPFHGCIQCEHYLHDTCLNTPRFLHHPYHPHHALNLFPSPTYPGRSFTCDACGSAGKSFCFSCAQCDRDLHPHCAALPQQLTDPEKHDHVLKLMYGYPVAKDCSVCEKAVDAGQWVYNCVGCECDAHLGCVKSGFSVPVEEREDEDGAGAGEPADSVQAVNQSMDNMNSMAVANIQAMERMARIQLQTNLARMNAHAVANMMRW